MYLILHITVLVSYCQSLSVSVNDSVGTTREGLHPVDIPVRGVIWFTETQEARQNDLNSDSCLTFCAGITAV